jgi:hypothetical protein
MAKEDKLLCPSYRCVKGARLIGIVRADRTVAFLGGSIPVDRQFARAAGEGRPPEVRFRFAGPCAQSGCANWNGGGCGIAAQFAVERVPPAEELPECGIRPQCRWFHERGPSACATCPQVVRGAG